MTPTYAALQWLLLLQPRPRIMPPSPTIQQAHTCVPVKAVCQIRESMCVCMFASGGLAHLVSTILSLYVDLDRIQTSQKDATWWHPLGAAGGPAQHDGHLAAGVIISLI